MIARPQLRVRSDIHLDNKLRNKLCHTHANPYLLIQPALKDSQPKAAGEVVGAIVGRKRPQTS